MGLARLSLSSPRPGESESHFARKQRKAVALLYTFRWRWDISFYLRVTCIRLFGMGPFVNVSGLTGEVSPALNLLNNYKI